MRRERNVFSMKEQDKNARKNYKMKQISNIPNKQSKVIIIKIFTRKKQKSGSTQ